MRKLCIQVTLLWAVLFVALFGLPLFAADTDCAASPYHGLFRDKVGQIVVCAPTYNPLAPGAPFVLGTNAQSQKVTGLNADLLDGIDSTGFITETDLSDEAELEAQLSDVTDVFTNNDGALNEDNLGDDNVDALADVDASCDGSQDQVCVGGGSSFAGKTLPSCSLETETLLYNTSTNEFSCGVDSGGALALDLANDGSNESAAIVGVNTTGDTNAIVTESPTDEILIDMSKDWPKADVADDVTCTSCVTNAELVNDFLEETELDTEAELEAQLGDVTNVYTNNDGLLTSDDLTNNNIADLSNVHSSVNDTDDEVLLGTGGAGYKGVNIPECGATSKLQYTDSANAFTCVADSGGVGQTITLDLADDASNESTAINEIATSGDTNDIFTEPSADKLLIDLSQNWPTADAATLATTATTANAGDSATAFFASGVLEHERGGLEVDVSAFNGIVEISGGATGQVNTSAHMSTAITDETGTDALVFQTSPTLTTPTLTLQDANGAAPTTDGQIKYDRTSETLEVGDGSATKEFFPGAHQALTAGTNISLSGSTLNVDDAFLVNNASDATTGTLTAAGYVGNAYDASGAVDLDIGSADVTDVTVVTDGGTIVLDGSITQDAGTTLVMGGTLDATGAVDMDYGSADITDHTFVTDGTGTAEIALPAGSIDSTELLDGTIVNVDINSSAAIALSKTALVAGTNITLSTDTLNVDDAFLKNDASDTTTGTITAAGYVGNLYDASGAADLDVGSADVTDITLLTDGGTVVIDGDILLDNNKSIQFKNAAGTTRDAMTFDNIDNLLVIASDGGHMKFQQATTVLMTIVDTGKIGMGTGSPDGTLHVHTATAGSVTADGGADDLVVENSTEVGITLLSPHDETSSIFFGSIDSNDDPVTDTARDARIHWRFSDSTFTFGTNTTGGLLNFKTDAGAVQLILAADGLATFSQDVSIGDLAAVGSDELCWDGSGASLIGDCSSLRQWKSNIVDTDMGLAEVLLLRAREFDWDEQHGHGRHDLGFVAEEVEEVNPLLVTYRPELTGVKYSKLTALLVKAIQELEARVVELEQAAQ